MELRINDYVRTKTKGIFKLDDSLYYNEDFKEYWFKAPTDVGDYKTTERSVIKSSPNILDLIEVGDYVNGIEVLGHRKDNENKDYLEMGLGNYVVLTYYQEDIKSIVTREQFERMEYEIEEKE